MTDPEAAATCAQANHTRQAEAALWLIAKAVNGTGLTIHEHEHHALITKPGHPDSAPIRIYYAGGTVSHNGTRLGTLDGYEPSSGQRISQAEILAAFSNVTPAGQAGSAPFQGG